jgi:exosortase A-associated hydrolase 1
MAARKTDDSAFFFPCEDEFLLGVLTEPRAEPADTGVLIVVGGPQYRAGSHRQFVLLSRGLAERGIPCLRFDYRGMGDSTGPMQSFVDALPDLRAAIDAFCVRVPGLRSIVLWGLCDAASIACLYASSDPRIGGLVLLNPWVRTESTGAKAILQHYYTQRVLEPSFWGKVFRGQFSFSSSLRSALDLLRASASGKPDRSDAGNAGSAGDSASLPDEMARGLGAFRGPSLVILSGRDLTAKEFLDVSESSVLWRSALDAPRVTITHLSKADHTFSDEEDQNAMARLTFGWINDHFPRAGDGGGEVQPVATIHKRGIERFSR